MSAASFSPTSRSLMAASPGGNLPSTGSSNQVFIERSLHISYFRVCLISITIACSRLRRSPDFLYFVENAQSAFALNREYILFNAHSTTLHPLHQTFGDKTSCERI